MLFSMIVMARVKGGVTSRARHEKILKMAKGYRGRSNNCYRIALERVEKALQYAYRDRRTKKRDFRSLWIQRINAGARALGVRYGELMHALKTHHIALDRKVLADLAVRDPHAFNLVVNQAMGANTPRMPIAVV